MTIDTVNGDDTWALLLELDPHETCKRAGVLFDSKSTMYTVQSFGQDFLVYVKERSIFGEGPICNFLLNKTDHFFDLAILWYLVSAKAIPIQNELIKPASMQGGQIFVVGTHVLPLDKVARKYGTALDEFKQRGEALGGNILGYGDASIQLFPFPRLPITLILWVGDDEFPAQLDLFFDVTCDQQLPTDVLWAIAMVSVLAILE